MYTALGFERPGKLHGVGAGGGVSRMMMMLKIHNLQCVGMVTTMMMMMMMTLHNLQCVGMMMMMIMMMMKIHSLQCVGMMMMMMMMMMMCSVYE